MEERNSAQRHKLDKLFAQLQEASSQETIRQIEADIWAIWYEHEDVLVKRLMLTGLKYLKTRDLAKAIAIFDDMLLIVPDYAEAWNKRATAHYLRGNYKQSLADIAKTLELEPRHFGALAGRAEIYRELLYTKQALETLKALERITPKSQALKNQIVELAGILAQKHKNLE